MKSYSKEDVNHLLIQQRKYKKLIRSFQENDCSQDYQRLQEKYLELQEQLEQQNHTQSETIKRYKKKNQQLTEALEEKERELTEWRQKTNLMEGGPADSENKKTPYVLSEGRKLPQTETIKDSVALLFQLLYYLDQKLTESSGQPLNRKRKEYDQAMDEQNPKQEPAASSTFLNHIKEPVQKESSSTKPKEQGKPIPPVSTASNQQNPFQADLLEKLQAEIAEMKELMKEQTQSVTETESHSSSPKPRRKEPALPQKPVANPYNPSTKQPQFNYRDLQGASVIPVIDKKGKKNHAQPLQSKKHSNSGTDTSANNVNAQIRVEPSVSKTASPNKPAIPTTAKAEQPILLKSEADKRAFLQKIKEQEEAKAAEKARQEQAETAIKTAEAQQQKAQKTSDKPEQPKGGNKSANTEARSPVNPESTGTEKNRPQTFAPQTTTPASQKAENRGPHTAETVSSPPQSTDQEKGKNQQPAAIKPAVQTETAKKEQSKATEEKKSLFKKFWDKVNS
ncbi:hypothetical protein ERJ70_04185 [Sediminibacillus dalangtanensis]|uniref:Uncharacterized protein n=1 Tax=Sediminibacillus dalangtanensis TaxID=2729421 RepID=A0ABX7VSI5_9BACI|nr:hypothetical protein [Sediminibacillus dalangtanensis]QTM98565.1 hypothetical protein ERJ70_04185 [Sediminibacillus dalangtanensis]